MKSLLLVSFTAAIVFAARLNIPTFGPSIPTIQSSVNYPQSFLTVATSEHPLGVALDFAKTKVPTQNGFSFVVKNHYKSDRSGVTHVYLKQTFNNVEVVNGDFNVHIDKFGRVVSFGSSFFNGQQPDNDHSFDDLKLSSGHEQRVFKAIDNDNIITPAEAVKAFADYANIGAGLNTDSLHEVLVTDQENSLIGSDDQPVFKVENVPFTADKTSTIVRKYLIVEQPEYRLAPVWDALFDMESGDDWFNAQIHMSTGNVLQLVNWVNEARYFVYPIGVNDPSDGDREMIINPEDKVASPLGWHDQGSAKHGKGKFNTTIGNNVYAQSNPNGRDYYENNYRPTGKGTGNDLVFDFPVDLSKEPETYLNASIINLFYWNNIMHDVFYQYGFDEKSGNFQEENFGRGGKGGDAVIAYAQDGSGYNNANFLAPPDGQKARMRMFVWTQTRPKRDGDLEAGIIIHEYGHGISTRLTGGPANSNCLAFGEAAGMGEGWGDIWSIMLRMRKEYKSDIEFGMGVYSAKRGIRPYPYSRSMKTNPHTYGYIKKTGYNGRYDHHAQGSVWASILYEVYWQFVDAYGFNPDWYAISDSSVKAGNLMFLQLLVDGLKLQPCRPSFVDARDAIIKANEIQYDGEHVCLLWKGFALRGLGYKAKTGGNEDFTLPQECS